ncbi:hypothetical protein MNEG_10360 [Monoraphidium neglectum]|uniref:Uncharacterized protein n=1 Tax=Monoraphidium neglectum TaxID=145388 RepID=A0A0D2JDG1_9CHLO|nr:hypothetical protein MNEG_10360 [Monoraphidium neglectum]KIY97602.1 hypothetical protein MNEG_10360 [Monoraphidium neglectum]|eukprot:XP_013896622.1 hypothetical protein MNEG_10360 [Monoraphidium neglectum]
MQLHLVARMRAQAKSALAIEKEQEALLAKKALAKEGKGQLGGPTVSMEEALPPRTSPVGPATITSHRAASKLEGAVADPMA